MNDDLGRIVMGKLFTIWQKLKTKVKNLILCALVLPLCACDDICPTIQDYIIQGVGVSETDCILCPFFDILIKISTTVAVNSWDIAHLFIPVVWLVAAIYIAIYTLKMVGSFGKQSATDYMSSDKKGILILMFKTAIIVSLLSGASGKDGYNIVVGFLGGGTNDNFLIQKIISPLLKSGLEIGQTLAVTSGNGRSFDFFLDDSILSELDSMLRSPWGAVFEMIKKAVYGFNSVTYEPVAIGQAMICNATLAGGILDWYYLMLLYGFILFIFGWLLTLGVGFYIVDILIDLMFAAVLLPFAVACAISPITMKYTKNVWGVFINVFFNFVMLGIILGIVMRVIDLCLARGIEEQVVDGKAVADVIEVTGGALFSFLSNYQDRIDANEVKELSAELWSNGSLLLTVVCLSVMTVLIPEIKKLAQKISDGTSISSAGSTVSGALAQHGLQTVEKAGQETYGRVVKPGAGVVMRMARADKWGPAARGFLTGGGSQGYRSMWNRQNAKNYWNNTRSFSNKAWQKVKGWF